MRGLSLTQPWASLLAGAHKRVETRSWSTDYRGPVAIHAAKNFPAWARSFCEEPRVVAALGSANPFLPVGAILAVAHLVDCRRIGPFTPITWGLSASEMSFGDYTEGRFAWFFEDIEALPKPIPARGALGLWELPAELLAGLAGVQ